MRRPTLPLALAASLTLGAAPLPQSSPVARAAECRTSHRAALAALRRLPVLDGAEESSEHAFGYTRRFDPAGLMIFGETVKAFNAADVNAIMGQSLTLVTRLDAPYEWVRMIALRSRNRIACADRDGPPGYCEIDERRIGGWTVTLILDADEGGPVLTCVYRKPSH